MKTTPFELFHRGESFRRKPSTMPREEWSRYCDAFAAIVAFPESADLCARDLHDTIGEVIYNDATPVEALRRALAAVRAFYSFSEVKVNQ